MDDIEGATYLEAHVLVDCTAFNVKFAQTDDNKQYVMVETFFKRELVDQMPRMGMVQMCAMYLASVCFDSFEGDEIKENVAEFMQYVLELRKVRIQEHAKCLN